jgi:tetratricopeptide (TPR) repeat protein
MPLQKKMKNPVKEEARIAAVAGKNDKASDGNYGKQAKPVPLPSGPPDAKVQLQAFERAIQLLHQRNYGDAMTWFEKARLGPRLDVTSRAAAHVRICERRLAAAPEPKSVEERYNYAVALMNLRNLAPARRHLEIALEMEPRADHVHYAMAVFRALSGDASGAYDSLKRAIELQPQNRMVARQDSDFDALGKQPRFSALLYPPKE